MEEKRTQFSQQFPALHLLKMVLKIKETRQQQLTTSESVIINWVSLVILFLLIVAFVLLVTGTSLLVNSLIVGLTAITFNRMFDQAFHIARRSSIPFCRDYFTLQLFHSYHCNHYIGISCQGFHIVSKNKLNELHFI